MSYMIIRLFSNVYYMYNRLISVIELVFMAPKKTIVILACTIAKVQFKFGVVFVGRREIVGPIRDCHSSKYRIQKLAS